MPKDRQANLNKQEKEALRQGFQLREMLSTKGWSAVLQPELEKKIKSELFDPKKFSNMDEIGKAYVIDFAERSAANWIFQFIEAIEKQTEGLLKKEKGEVEPDKFNIGA